MTFQWEMSEDGENWTVMMDGVTEKKCGKEEKSKEEKTEKDCGHEKDCDHDKDCGHEKEQKKAE